MGTQVNFPSPIGRGRGPLGTAEWEGEGILAAPPTLTLPALRGTHESNTFMGPLRASLPLPVGVGQ